MGHTAVVAWQTDEINKLISLEGWERKRTSRSLDRSSLNACCSDLFICKMKLSGNTRVAEMSIWSKGSTLYALAACEIFGTMSVSAKDSRRGWWPWRRSLVTWLIHGIKKIITDVRGGKGICIFNRLDQAMTWSYDYARTVPLLTHPTSVQRQQG